MGEPVDWVEQGAGGKSLRALLAGTLLGLPGRALLRDAGWQEPPAALQGWETQMSRTFRATPFRTSYRTADQLGLMEMAAEKATDGEDFVARDRRLNGYDRRGVTYLNEPWGWPWGFNDYGDLENRPRMKRHVKRQTSRIVRRLGDILMRAEVEEAQCPA